MSDDDPTQRAERFLALHQPGEPLLLPNAHDVGSARILASLGFEALATTSGGFAATQGRTDYAVPRDEAIRHGAALAAAVDVPVSADTENGFADAPEAVAETIRAVAATGLAGCSIEDFTTRKSDPIYPKELAAERVAAVCEAASGEDGRQLVITARAENHLHGRRDLADTIARLQAFQEAGADVLYAPGISALDDIRAVVTSVDRPVNVLALPGSPPVSALAAAGVARISVGGVFAFAAYGELIDGATELRDRGTYGYWERALRHWELINDALAGPDEA